MRSPFGAALTIIARSPVPLAPRASGAGFSWGRTAGGGSEMDLLQTTAMVGTVFAIVNRITTAVSKADWHLYRKAASGLKEDRVEVTSHAVIDLWDKPNPFMPRRRFMEWSQQHVELVGKNNMVLTFAGGLRGPIEMWPVLPTRIKPVPDPYDFIAGYIYTSPDGERVPLESRQVLRTLMPNPLDPYNGLGPVSSILTTIDATKFSDEWNRAFFENDATPGGIVEFPNAVEDAAFNQFTQRWRETHQGVSNAHRVAVLEAGAKWVSTAFSQKDMQFTELSTTARDKIMEAWGFPRPMLGITEDVNRANAEAAEYMFSKWLIEERLDRWRDLLNYELLPLYGPTTSGLEWDYDSPVAENSEQENAALTARSNAVKALLTIPGIEFDPAAALAAVNLPDIPFEKVEPPPPVAPFGAPGQKPPTDPTAGEGSTDRLLREWALAEIEAANRWVAVEEEDDSTCEPCAANRGKVYKNRAAAYEDYPDGEGYVKCVGAEFGNACRGKVVKRKRD